MQVLHAVPEIKVEALIALCPLPSRCEFVDVASSISQEELGHILIVLLVPLVVVGGEIYSFGELRTVIMSHLGDLDELAAVLVNQELKFCVQLLDGILVLLSWVSNQLF